LFIRIYHYGGLSGLLSPSSGSLRRRPSSPPTAALRRVGRKGKYVSTFLFERIRTTSTYISTNTYIRIRLFRIRNFRILNLRILKIRIPGSYYFSGLPGGPIRVHHIPGTLQVAMLVHLNQVDVPGIRKLS